MASSTGWVSLLSYSGVGPSKQWLPFCGVRPLGNTQQLPRPNNRLQGMRGLACFWPDESLARRPRTPDPCVVRRLRDRLRRASSPAETAVA
jgi:hypothetical protein